MTDNDKAYYKTNLSLKRTRLAVAQTKMAAKRTLLSYISTASVFISLALAYLKLIEKELDILTVILFGVALLFIVFGVIDYYIIKRSVKDVLKDCILEDKEGAEDHSN